MTPRAFYSSSGPLMVTNEIAQLHTYANYLVPSKCGWMPSLGTKRMFEMWRHNNLTWTQSTIQSETSRSSFHPAVSDQREWTTSSAYIGRYKQVFLEVMLAGEVCVFLVEFIMIWSRRPSCLTSSLHLICRCFTAFCKCSSKHIKHQRRKSVLVPKHKCCFWWKHFSEFFQAALQKQKEPTQACFSPKKKKAD